MKGQTMLATMQRRGLAASRRRPCVCNDNPYPGSLFKRLRYRSQFPLKPFEDLLNARRRVTELAHWYNDEHRHSAIGFAASAQRYACEDRAMLHARTQVCELARQENSARWSKNTRNWRFVDAVCLNPETLEKSETDLAQKAA